MVACGIPVNGLPVNDPAHFLTFLDPLQKPSEWFSVLLSKHHIAIPFAYPVERALRKAPIGIIRKAMNRIFGSITVFRAEPGLLKREKVNFDFVLLIFLMFKVADNL